MDRRNALKLLGALVVCIGGTATSVKSEIFEDSSDNALTFSTGPYDYHFSEEGIRNITIGRKDQPDLVISFKEVVKSLEYDELERGGK